MAVIPSPRRALGLSSTGRPAELVCVKKNGEIISIATGQPFKDMNEDSESPNVFKCAISEQLHEQEEILRSMARRKKNACPTELVPKKFKEPGCNKEFKRLCDLTKYEKTHSRPWKCPVRTCKDHEYRWSTEEEMDRHVYDKHHSSNKESNYKQHIKKIHGWTYVRTKTNGRAGKEDSSAGITPSDYHEHSLITPLPGSHIPIIQPYEDEAFKSDDVVRCQSAEEFKAFDPEFELHPWKGDISTVSHYGLPPYNEIMPNVTNQSDSIYSNDIQIPITEYPWGDGDPCTKTIAQLEINPPKAHHPDHIEKIENTLRSERTKEDDRTDSGYASVVRLDNSLHKHEKEGKEDGNKISRLFGLADIGDAETIVSAATAINTDNVHESIAFICDDIYQNVRQDMDTKSYGLLAGSFPVLVKIFAMMVGADASSRLSQRIMLFIYKYHE